MPSRSAASLSEGGRDISCSRSVRVRSISRSLRRVTRPMGSISRTKSTIEPRMRVSAYTLKSVPCLGSNVSSAPRKPTTPVETRSSNSTLGGSGRLGRTLPPSVEFDDLVSTGVVGFLGALDTFDPRHGTDFSVYALTRIRGSMVDFVREIDPIGRVTRRKLREVERTLADLEQEMSRPPSDSEAAERLGISIDNYHELLSRARAAMTLSLEWVE